MGRHAKTLAALGLVVLFQWTCVSWARGYDWPTFGVLDPFVGVIFGLCFLRYLVRSDIRPEVPTESLGGRWREELDRAGLAKVRLLCGADRNIAPLPRLMAIGSIVTVPKRVADDYSEDALLWSLKTDSAAAMAFYRTGLPGLLSSLCVGLLLVTACSRWKLPNVWLLLPVGVILIGIVASTYLGFCQQVAADRRFTVTEGDRRAARGR